jgi:cystathionine beta-synthase
VIERSETHDRTDGAIGGTPLVALSRCLAGSAPEGCRVFAKLEMLNPMGSVKDRVARHMVERALADGRLRPGGTIVESSSGNTGMGLAMMAVLHGLRCVLVVRRQCSPEKLGALRALGAELVLVDGELPPEHPESYNRKAKRLAAEHADWYFPDQHNNRENNEAHYRTTGPEIWRQMDGRLDWLVAGIGTGGTISGTGRYLKEQDPRIRVVAVDVEGSVFTEWFHHRRLGRPRPYRLEGLGDEEIIGCPELEVIDDMLQVTDRDAFLATRELARTEGLFAGGSSGAALWGVRRLLAGLAARGGLPATGGPRIVTILPDSGNRYLSTIYDDGWMRAHGYLEEPAASETHEPLAAARG